MMRDRMGSDSISYEVLRELPRLTAISSDWDALVQRSRCNRAFSSSTWFLAACRVMPAPAPYVIAARRGGTLVGLFPLVVTPDGSQAGFPNSPADYNDMIAAPDDAGVLTGLLEHALSSRRGYERIVLKRLRLDSNCAQAVRLMHPTLNLDGPPNKQVCFYVRLSSSYHEYLAGKSRNFRKSLKRAQRRADENNIVARHLTPDTFPPDQVPEVFLSLHLSRLGDESCFRLPENQSFVRLALPVLFAERKMHVFGLFRGERMIGIDLCMVGADSLCTWNGGFLPEAGSSGHLLIDAGIRQACGMNLQEYDLLRGFYEWKARWATHTRDVVWLELKV